MANVTKYRCSCGATDSDAGNNGPAPVALICHKCKAGSGMSPTEQFHRGVGMLPVMPDGVADSLQR